MVNKPVSKKRAAAAAHAKRSKAGLARVVRASTAEADRRTREAMHEAIILAAKDAVIAVDDAQRIVLFNPAAEHIFGYSAAEMIGERLDRLIPVHARLEHRAHVQGFGERKDTMRAMGHDRVVQGLRANGQSFPVDATISLITFDGMRRYVAVVRDVTERMRMADELKRSLESLQRAEAELRESRDSLRELSAALQSIREEEKTRIARELHDELGQALTALKMDASAIASDLAPREAELIRRANGMKALIDSTVASVRRISADLRPVMLDSLGLTPTLEWLVREFERRSGVRVALTAPEDDMGASGDVATAAFRIVQEALTNVARHARAKSAVVSVARDGGDIRVCVEDDGVGILPKGKGKGAVRSFGLLGMRERAYVLGGRFSVRAGKRSGTVVEAIIPVQAAVARRNS